MPDLKISQLTAITPPIAGTDVLPVVQSSTTKKITVAQLVPGLGSFTAPSGNVKGLVWSDGTVLANDSTVTDVGYDTVTNTVKARNLDVSTTLTTGNWASSGFTLSSNGIITESTTSRTLSAADNGKVIYCTNGSTTTITTATTLGAGFSCTIIQGGAGKVTVAQGASTTLVSYSSLFSTMGQYAAISLICPVADTFIAAGNLGV